MKICILIPVYNESKSIANIIRTLKSGGYDVVVVDDGSSDGSGQIAEQAGAKLISHAKNQGKGASLQDGFDFALKEQYDAVLTMDGDGQHAVSDIVHFLEKARNNPGAIITGNRMQNHQGMPITRLWINWAMSKIISAMCHQKIPDTQCGFRLISRDILKEIKVTSCDYEIETEVLIRASQKGFRIYSVPIQTIYAGEASKINPVVDTGRFLKFIFKELWNSKS